MKKRYLFGGIVLAVALLLIAMAVGRNNTAYTEFDNNTINEVLSGQKSFIDFYSQKAVNVNSPGELSEGYSGGAYMYAVLDADRDGTDELFIEYAGSGETIILDIQQGMAVAYGIPYRGRLDLKADGTMTGSSGAANSRVYSISFGDNGIEYTDIIVCNETDGEFIVNGETVSLNECRAAMEKQQLKENVKWLEI